MQPTFSIAHLALVASLHTTTDASPFGLPGLPSMQERFRTPNA
jgi:hypothetical protein